MRLLTWNIQNRGDLRPVGALPGLAEHIRRTGCELALLQEVTAPMLDRLRELLQPYSIIGVGREDGKEAGEFVPILVLTDQLRVARSGWFWLGPTPDIPSRGWFALCPRICTWAVLERVGSGGRFLLVNNHWDHFSFYSRRRGWRQVLDLVDREGRDGPVILGGDFNLGPRRPLFQNILRNRVKPLRDAWAEAHPGAKDWTYRGFRGGWFRQRVDHFFLSPEWILRGCRILGDPEILAASDHRPVVVEVG
ncbi:MAG: endonuclease/exonuclease/phosphatase family protein [Puniceicoccaceae bacterium]|nr:MAG: endonuclease/exonuclease/phosphatase family protein [Puniceicoccaceae bacterium]